MRMSPMPESGRVIVTNTTPLIALAVATGSLDILRAMYARVLVPAAVANEILAGGDSAPGVAAFRGATWLEHRPDVRISSYLSNSLDRGEAAVIQTALDESIALVCIDEAVGRRVARLNGLTVTGSVGILVKAHQQGYAISLADAIRRMREHGIWLADGVVCFAMEHDASTQ